MTNISEHLQGPRRRKREFVFFAFGRSFDRDLYKAIDTYFHQKHQSFFYARPKTASDIRRMITRKILILMIDDSFDSIAANMEIAKFVKESKREEPLPIVFFTKDTPELVEAYNKIMPLYHELDTYIPYNNLDRQQIFDRLERTLSGVDSGRRSRRYASSISADCQLLGAEEKEAVRIVDISMHGCQIEFSRFHDLNLGSQLRLRIPMSGQADRGMVEYLSLSGKVRRIFLNGTRFGVSWEHLGKAQYLNLTEYLFNLVRIHESRS